MAGKTIAQMKIGDSASLTRTITDEDVRAFAALTGDFNPVHVDDEAAKRSRFGKRVVHGMLVGSLFSTIFGTQLPGEGAVYLKQELKFIKPVYIGDTVTARVTLMERIEEKNRVVFETVAINAEGVLVVTGQATLLAPEEARA